MAGSYHLPHGHDENQRLDTQHRAIVSLIGDSVFHAPVAKPQRILDIGSGSGVVTAHLAQQFPEAQVIGIDLAPALPSRDNMRFLQGDFFELADSGQLENGTFDFIFSRMLIAGMKDWAKMCRVVDRLLRPGGWAEMQDLSYRICDDNGDVADERSPLFGALQALSLHKGLDPFCGENLQLYMADNMSLESVTHNLFPWAWIAMENRPETRLIAVHNQSEQHRAVEGYLLDKLNSDTGVYTDEEITELQRVHWVSKSKNALHCVYGVAYGQKSTQG